jgi:hypothetical protein
LSWMRSRTALSRPESKRGIVMSQRSGLIRNQTRLGRSAVACDSVLTVSIR